jgi:hypothetical protein
VRRSEEMLVLAIPLDLRARRAPCAQPHERPFPCPQVPPPYPGVHRHSSHEIWVKGVPVDVGYGSRVGIDGFVETLLCRQIPYEQLLR